LHHVKPPRDRPVFAAKLYELSESFRERAGKVDLVEEQERIAAQKSCMYWLHAVAHPVPTKKKA
jgi:hypothetical protein